MDEMTDDEAVFAALADPFNDECLDRLGHRSDGRAWIAVVIIGKLREAAEEGAVAPYRLREGRIEILPLQS